MRLSSACSRSRDRRGFLTAETRRARRAAEPDRGRPIGKPALARNGAVVVLAAIAVCACGADAPRELVDNGDFHAVDAGGAPTGWGLPAGGSVAVEPENRFLHLVVTKAGEAVDLYRVVRLDGAKAIRFACRVRYDGVERGAEGWHDARILLHFVDAKNAEVGHDPAAPAFTGSSRGWQDVESRARVPDGAVGLAIMPGLFHAKAGTFDLDDISVTAIDPATLPAEKPQRAIVVDGGKRAPPRLHVDGAKLLDADGKEVWLQGVNVPSLGWSNTGDGIAVASVIAAVERWNANVIRLAVDAQRWLGTSAQQAGAGEPYRALVDQAITAATSRGAYVVLDLHGFRAPKDESVAFWKDAAARYRDRGEILFGLFNEPCDISWEVWRDGGKVGEKRAAAQGPDAARDEFDSPGMQKVVDAVRAAGAKNVLVIGGLDWSYDLSGVTDGFALNDRGGDGIVWDTHVYYWKSGWQKAFLDCAAKHPVLVGECGADAKRFDFIPAERFEPSWTWAPDFLACVQRHHLHWTAWSFHPGAAPCLISDLDDFTPTWFWGAYVDAALHGARFSSDKLR